MNLRTRVRLLRMYFKSWNLFKEAFRNYRTALFFPFFGEGNFLPRGGAPIIRVPREYWTMLPTAARLALIGAHPQWKDGHLHISYRNMKLKSLPFGKMIALSLREIYEEDVYHIGNRDLSGKVVIDIGAYVGDSSIAFAAKGATVHAFEPELVCTPYLTSNVGINDLPGKVHIHTVGLSDAHQVIGTGSSTITLVDAVDYMKTHNINQIDIVKLDCEGCEYELMKPNGFLMKLRPSEIIMEYHRGGETLQRMLQEHGYSVQWPERVNPVGYMYATRTVL